ncbi:hypothetical protein [Erythrobacter ani]|uniref:Uncharacterized protein n=1 Tax=Erythrobacter ani TaxID=2827235 RepID=A0ABS6SKA1_9SPHN|nr:hypothetical protein [Erythrobacter ani]MBV7265410.1 hypothetical protein [Erythrobacter ani]
MNAEAQKSAGFLGRGPVFWMAMFVVSIAALATLKLTGAIEGPALLILGLASMGLMVPAVLAGERRGCASQAMVKYNRRILIASFGYVLGLGIAMAVWNTYQPSGPVVFFLALLPTLPTFMMIWAMGRYLIDEDDKYLRFRTVQAALISLGFVLAIGIFWGFLETFELVPHIWAWWVLPVWAIGLGVAQLVMKVRGG